MQFLSRSDQAYPTEEKPLVRTQAIVLRHLYLLLGYSPIDRTFHVTPSRLRASAVFNAFLSTLPQTLDQNHLMGWTLLPTALHVLLYSPSTSLVANANNDTNPGIPYTYSLWRLEPHIRRHWLMSVEVIMYKVSRKRHPETDGDNITICLYLFLVRIHAAAVQQSHPQFSTNHSEFAGGAIPSLQTDSGNRCYGLAAIVSSKR